MSVTAQSARVDVIAAFKAQMGFAAPKSWSREKIVAAMNGQHVNKGRTAKKIVAAAYEKAMGIAPAASWTGKTIQARLEAGKAPQSRTGSGMTVVELRKQASERQIPGRSKMNKVQLIAAIEADKVKNTAKAA